MSSPWDVFDDDVRDALREAVGHELDRAFKPLEEQRADVERAEDQAFANAEEQMRRTYSDYDAHRAEILTFALQNNIGDVGAAYTAWRQSPETQDRAFAAEEARAQAAFGEAYTENRQAILRHGLANGIPTAEGAFRAWQASETAATEGASRRDARIAELKFKDDVASQMEKSKLEQERDESRDARALKLTQDANDPDRFRREIIGEINQAANSRNRDRTTRTQFGRTSERTPTKSKEERYGELDLQAIDLFRGKEPGTVQGPTRSARDADRNGLSDLEQRFSDALHAENESGRAESALQDIREDK